MTEPGRHAAARRPAEERIPLCVAVVATLMTLALLALLSAVVSAGRTVGFDDSARVWFRASGEWGWPQRGGDAR